MSITSPSQISSIYMPAEALHDLVLANPSVAHIKDAKTGSYILVNKKSLELYGLESSEQLVGLTIFDMDKFMSPYWGKKYAEEINKMDYTVVTYNKVLTKESEMLLNSRGHVYIHNLVKIPLLDRNNKISSLLTISNDRTDKIDRFVLLGIYMNMYQTKSVAISRFMDYLDISRFFTDKLTYKEISCILYMRSNSSYKYVAKKLDISIKTVETHLSHITKKLKNFHLINVLSHLRGK